MLWSMLQRWVFGSFSPPDKGMHLLDQEQMDHELVDKV